MGKKLNMDSVFCVAEVISNFYRHGVFRDSMAKNYQYWKNNVMGDEIDP